MTTDALTAELELIVRDALDRTGLDADRIEGAAVEIREHLPEMVAVVLNASAQRWAEKATTEPDLVDRYRHRAAASVATDELIVHNTHRAGRAAWQIKNGGQS